MRRASSRRLWVVHRVRHAACGPLHADCRARAYKLVSPVPSFCFASYRICMPVSEIAGYVHSYTAGVQTGTWTTRGWRESAHKTYGERSCCMVWDAGSARQAARDHSQTQVMPASDASNNRDLPEPHRLCLLNGGMGTKRGECLQSDPRGRWIQHCQ